MVRRAKLITYVLSFARTEYYRFIVVVVEPAVDGWCAHSVCRYRCVLIVFAADTQVAISISVFQNSSHVGNKFVRHFSEFRKRKHRPVNLQLRVYKLRFRVSG